MMEIAIVLAPLVLVALILGIWAWSDARDTAAIIRLAELAVEADKADRDARQ